MLQLPNGAIVIGLTDNIAVMIIAKNNEVPEIEDVAIHIIHKWLREAGLELSVTKLKSFLFLVERRSRQLH